MGGRMRRLLIVAVATFGPLVVAFEANGQVQPPDQAAIVACVMFGPNLAKIASAATSNGYTRWSQSDVTSYTKTRMGEVGSGVSVPEKDGGSDTTFYTIESVHGWWIDSSHRESILIENATTVDLYKEKVGGRFQTSKTTMVTQACSVRGTVGSGYQFFKRTLALLDDPIITTATPDGLVLFARNISEKTTNEIRLPEVTLTQLAGPRPREVARIKFSPSLPNEDNRTDPFVSAWTTAGTATVSDGVFRKRADRPMLVIFNAKRIISSF